jgi:hypothetical protein
MNHEFEWRNQMRKLGGPVEPARELWPDIAARIADAPAQSTSRRRIAPWLAMAATLAIAVGVGTFYFRGSGHSTPDRSTQALTRAPVVPSATPATSVDEPQRTALDWAMPADPALAATAQNLDNASAQLQGALEQRPDAVFLVGLLNRTNSQRLRLMRKSPYAG